MEDHEKTIEKEFEKISKLSGISEKTIELIKRFDKENTAEGIKPISRCNYIQKLRYFLDAVKKPLEDVNKDDLVNFFSGSKYKTNTNNMFRETLTKFYRWMGDGEFPQHLKAAKKILNQVAGGTTIPKNLLDAEDVKKLMMAAVNPRDRLLPLFLYESGCRIGEALNIKLKDITFDEYGAKVFLEGKTGQRTIRIIDGALSLREWIENHPHKNEKETSLFCQFKENKQNGTGNFLSPECIRKIIKTLAKRAGIGKPVNPHAFRHARMTQLAGELTEFELRAHAGWSMSSPMAAVYVHRSGLNLDNKMLANRGLIDLNGKDSKKRGLENVNCPACQMKNSVISRFCHTCGQPLSPEAVQKYKEQKLGTELYRIMLNAPGGQQYLERLMQENRETIKSAVG